MHDEVDDKWRSALEKKSITKSIVVNLGEPPHLELCLRFSPPNARSPSHIDTILGARL